MSKHNRVGRALLATVTLIILACTCGPLSRVQELSGTAGAFQGTAGAFATEFGTVQAAITDMGPTLEAQLTELGPTFEAQFTDVGPTLDALQTEVVEALPSLEAQITAIAGTPEPAEDGLATRQWAAGASASSQFGDPGWSAQQATGAPDTPECGDYTTAWASATPTGVDWIALQYETAVTPTRLEIHQTYNPGAIVRVELAGADGSSSTVYEAEPARQAECPFVLVIPVSGVEGQVNQVTIYLDQTNHERWNEIDAVELIGNP